MRFGPYEVTRELGQGGMGAVYAARHPSLGRDVAIKVLAGAGAASPEALARFRQEGEAVARLDHPGIVRVHDLGDEQGVPYLVMDLVRGESLDALVARDGPLRPREAARLVADVARALAHAHARGVIHRDVKPDNVLMAGRRPVLTDFGVAKVAEHALTATGTTVGTPSYMAPEQVDGQGGAVDARADVWALGATLYHLLTGRPPFEGVTVVNLMAALLTRPPPPPSSLRRGIDPGLEAVCLRCLEKRREDRFASADELARALDDWAAGRAAARRGWSLPAVAGAGLAGGLLVGLGAALLRPPPAPAVATTGTTTAAPEEDEEEGPDEVFAAGPTDAPPAPAPTRAGGWAQGAGQGPLPGRAAGALARLPRGRGLVLHGGIAAGRNRLGDTWLLEVGGWRLLDGDGPRARYGHAAALDVGRGVVVLHGGAHPPDGREAPVVSSETWELDGERWALRAPSGGAPPRFKAAMAHHPGRKVTVLFGGFERWTDAAGPRSGETWLWDGARWARAPGRSPSARIDAGMAYDERRGVIVLFGGKEVKRHLRDTWEWDGAWRPVDVEGPPPRVARGALAYDPRRQACVLLGGIYGGRELGDAWLFDGERWTREEDLTPPSARHYHHVEHDLTRGRLVLVGGAAGRAILADWWEE